MPLVPVLAFRSPFWQRHRHALLLLAILALALVVRLHHLMAEGLWTDEMISLYTSNPEASLRRTYDVLHFWDQTPPLYPVLLWLWLKLTVFTDVQARLFSVLGGMLGLFALHQLLRDLVSRRSALCVTLIVALTPYHIYFSREARSYIWALLLATLFLHAALRRLSGDGSRRLRTAFVISGALFLYSSYFSFFLFASVALLAIVQAFRGSRMSSLVPWFVDYGCIALLFLPWLIPFLRILGYHNGPTSTPSPWYFLDVLSVFSSVSTAGVLLAVAYLLLIGYCGLFWLRAPRQQTHRNLFFSVFFLAVCSYGMMLVKSLGGRNILNGFAFSYVIVLLPFFALALAMLLQQLRPTLLAAFLLIFLLANALHLNAWAESSYRKLQSEPYREISQFLERSVRPGEAIVVFAPYIQEYYLSRAALADRLTGPAALDRTLAGSPVAAKAGSSPSDASNPPKRLWVVDSYDRKADVMLASLRARHPLRVLHKHQISGPASDRSFRIYHLQLDAPSP